MAEFYGVRPTLSHRTRIHLWTLSPTAVPQILLPVAIAGVPNAAFIEITDLGWKVDWRRFRIHLREHYRVGRAFYFIGYVPDNQPLYTRLQNAGYTLIFKPVTYRGDGKPKGNAY